MTFNFDQCNIVYSQIGDNNIMNNSEALTESDWKCLENLFEQKANEFKPGSESFKFINKSKEYVSNRDEKSLKNFIKEHSNEFLKNVFYNLTSTSILKLLCKLGYFI